MNEVIREFLIETHENLAQLDLDLVALEKSPTDSETLARVFRTLHTVKGTAGFLGLQKLQSVSHGAENLLSRLRDGQLIFNAPIASALLSVVDAIRQMLEAVENTETDGDGDFSALVQTLERLRGSAVMSSPAPRGPDQEIRDSSDSAPPLTVPPPAPSLVMPESAVTEPAETRASAVSDSTIRVDVGLLDKLMNLVGELVLARNQIVQVDAARKEEAFSDTVQKLNLLTTELQAGVMKTRMQPIGTIWNKLRRVVRDLAVACGKQARLVLEGQETEMDKTIIEAIRDPLTHLVRNAVDHGIEPPAERLARGKSAEGRLALHAFHEGGKVVIEISDDGAGLDPGRIRAKAIQAGLVTAEQAGRLNERELVNLIFLPGFSTAAQVTEVSGRGVGMDVVRTNIEKIGGTVAIESRPGLGATLRMRIPLTLAIIPALTISSGGDRYAIPQVNLVELVRLEAEDAQRGIERFHEAPVYRLRGNLLPLVFLDQQLRGDGSRVGRACGATSAINVVVLQADERQFGLVVDAVHDTEEIVVKPLAKQLKGIGVFAGATIMGDGKVALILDVPGIAQHAKVVSGAYERSLCEKPAALLEPAGDRQTVVVFAVSGGGRMAISLSAVARLEKFPRKAVEKVGPQDVVQYRDEILPLVHVSRVLRREQRKNRKSEARSQRRPGPFFSKQRSDDDTVHVVVCARAGRRVGLVVERIVDIVEETLVCRAPAGRRGVLFTAVIQGRVTEFLDIDWIMGGADADVVETPGTIAAEI